MLIWSALLFASGWASLTSETVWLRRLGTIVGGSSTASTITVSTFMAGLGVGALLSRRIRTRHTITWAALEGFAACWALLMPWLLQVGSPLLSSDYRLFWAAALLAPPSIALGATWPLIARTFSGEHASRLYAMNTAGAVAGVVAATFFVLPTLGVRGTEVFAAVIGILAATLAFNLSDPWPKTTHTTPAPVHSSLAMISFVTGFVALAMEMVWFRLASIALGATVQMMGLVLATFLMSVAIGSLIGERLPNPKAKTTDAVYLIAITALAGCYLWAEIPFFLAAVYRNAGPEYMLSASGLIAMVSMGGAPFVSGAAFSLCIRSLKNTDGAGSLMAINTAGSVLGAVAGAWFLLPHIQGTGAMLFCAGCCLVVAAYIKRKWGYIMVIIVMMVMMPPWDSRLFALGVHLRISDFKNPTRQGIEAFVSDGWELLYYKQGATAAVAVGRSTTTNNVWLSINGKVDASTGADMPTQYLSGSLPTLGSSSPTSVLVVGLASGVTAGAVLEDERVQTLTILELEPEVVVASHYFDHVNQRPLDDPRTTLKVDDARAHLRTLNTPIDLIISEPSNPWITGVSNLFTKEYWTLAKSKLSEKGVFCQWVQLYGMGPSEFRGIIRTFQAVFGDVYLYESIEGTDILLLGGDFHPSSVPQTPRLTPAQVRRLAGQGWLNTDDQPRVEWRAPGYLHYDTSDLNSALIEEASSP